MYVLNTDSAMTYTSLMRALMSPDNTAPVLSSEAITDGIDISTWAVNRAGINVQYSVWDFAGQTVYYNTHQVLITLTNMLTVKYSPCYITG